VHIHNNNNMLLKNSAWDGVGYVFRPWLKGGHIEFDVDLSHMECGCVAGFYVANNTDGDKCGEESM